jgi:hypothetical protein
LTRIDRAITSYVDMSKSLTSAGLNSKLSTKPVGVTTVLSTGQYLYNYFETDIIDFNMRAIKTIVAVEINASIGSGLSAEVMIKWRNDSDDAFTSTAWFRCSPSGITQVPVSGRDFKICYRTTYSTSVAIHGVTVEWQLSDKMNVRGNYTNVSSLGAKSS